MFKQSRSNKNEMESKRTRSRSRHYVKNSTRTSSDSSRSGQNISKSYVSSSSSLSSSRQSSSSSSSSANARHFRYRIGHYIGKYKVKDFISDGTFGRVLLVEKNDKKYAMKIIRPLKAYIESAKEECEILNYVLKRADPKRFVNIYCSFYYKKHFVIVFERLGPSLHDLIRKNHYNPMPRKILKKFAYQLLTSLDQLHQIGVIHTDLKPENILFQSPYPLQYDPHYKYYLPPKDLSLKIIDFGGAVYDDEDNNFIINTRQYRAPEVQLECCRWNQATDVWGLGCILMELYNGTILFATRRNEFEHMALVEKICGQFPHWMAKDTKGPLKQFMLSSKKNGSYYDWDRACQSKDSRDKVMRVKQLGDLIADQSREDDLFFALMRDMLEVDPKLRITCRYALNYEYFFH